MEGCEKNSRCVDFEDAANMPVVWARCQETCISEAVNMIKDMPEGHECHISIEIEADMLIPRNAAPVVVWTGDREGLDKRERFVTCVVVSGIDQWVFIRDGIHSFMRGIASAVRSSSEWCKTYPADITEGNSVTKCRFSLFRPLPPSPMDIVMSDQIEVRASYLAK